MFLSLGKNLSQRATLNHFICPNHNIVNLSQPARPVVGLAQQLQPFPLTVRIRTAERSRLAKLLMDATPMTSITFGDQPDELLVRTPKPDQFYAAFQDCLVESGVKVSAIDSPDDNLNAIFEYLVG